MGFQRDIVERKYYRTSSHPRSAKDSCIVVLECGHERRFKGSQVPRIRALCYDCRDAYERCKGMIKALRRRYRG